MKNIIAKYKKQGNGEFQISGYLNSDTFKYENSTLIWSSFYLGPIGIKVSAYGDKAELLENYSKGDEITFKCTIGKIFENGKYQNGKYELNLKEIL